RGRGRHLEIVGGEERHRGKHAEHANEDDESNEWCGEHAERTHLEPPAIGVPVGATMTESAPSPVITTAAPGGSAPPSAERATCSLRSPPTLSAIWPTPPAGIPTDTSAEVPTRLCICSALEACCE